MQRWSVIPLAVSAFAAFAMPASAADAPVYKAPRVVQAIDFGNLYFGTDIDSHGGIVGYAGVLWAPAGMHQSGLRLSAFGLYGKYKYDAGDSPDITGRFWLVDALIGYSFVFQNGALTLSVGPNFQNHRLSASDPENSVQGSEVGLKVQGDIWMNPTPTTLIFALASYSTAFQTYYTLGRYGFDVTPGHGIFVGPEVGASGNERTDQVRVGAFISNISLSNRAKVGFSTGWLHERGEGSGWYGTAVIDFRF